MDSIEQTIEQGLASKRRNIVRHAEQIKSEIDRLRERLAAEATIADLEHQLAEARKLVRRRLDEDVYA